MMTSDSFAKVLDALRTKVSDFNYRNWFQSMGWEFEAPARVTLKVPSKFIRDWLQDHYLELIKFEIFRQTEQECEVIFKVDKTLVKTPELFPSETKSQFKVDAISADGENKSKPVTASKPAESGKAQSLGFNPNYTFESFVVGSGCQLVHAACQNVSHQPAKSYNPLFIYGGVGLGKTHLLNAVGLEILKKHPHWKVVYVTGEHFTNEVINAIRYDKTIELRKKYRENCDVFLIDDIQFIAGKERTMEEFFHTFNALYEARKQIILTSDKLPKDMLGLEERLRSRFGWGLLADIQLPDFETRLAILQKKAEKEGLRVPRDVLDYIAQNVSSNVRDLEGALIRVFAFASLSKVSISLDLAREVLHHVVTTTRPKLTIESVQNTVCQFYNLKSADLKSKRRHKNLAVPRQIAMYLCKKHIKASYPEIGLKFGGKDHTTVLHAFQKITGCLGSDNGIRGEVSELEKILGI